MFVSIDCEFTGIRGEPEIVTDTPEERYAKVNLPYSSYR